MKQTYIYALLATALYTIPSYALAQVQMEFRPHCTDFSLASENPFGEVPAVGFMYELENDNCTQFSSKDPQTLQIIDVAKDDSLEVDVVLKNPTENDITAVNTLITFDPTVFSIEEVAIDTDYFTEITPGGDSIDNEMGTVSIIANTSDTNPITDNIARVATFRVNIIGTTGNSTIQFGAVQSGATGVYASLSTDSPNLLTSQPAALYFGFNAESDASLNDALTTTTSTQAENISSSNEISSSSAVATQKNIGEQCQNNDECASGRCNNQVCAQATISVANGEACIVDFQCESFFCNNGICSEQITAVTSLSSSSVPSSDPVSTSSSSESSVATEPNTLLTNNVAFSLLQVQNVRLTTEDTNAYIAWDTLQSSQVQGYIVYYGTVRAQYIQRKTVPATEKSVAIRNLPKGVQYFFAVKAINSVGDESAFSPEVSVVIGDASTSTSPLSASLVSANTAIVTSDETNLSDTGAMSAIAIIAMSFIGIGIALFIHNKKTFAILES
jgi:Fibronectin type III domain/Cohesin domain